MKFDEASKGLNDLTDYYELLDLKPSANPAEIREAYFRAKSTYQKDNVALYTLIDTDDREEMLARIEEAYQVLANPDRRRDYDRLYGQISSSPFAQSVATDDTDPTSILTGGSSTGMQGGSHSGPKDPRKIISIDRNPPFDSAPQRHGASSTPDPSLSPPRTDFDVHYASGMALNRREPSALQTPSASTPAAPNPPSTSQHKPTGQSHFQALTEELDREIREQTDWSGAFLRKIREARGVSIEEVTLATKITKSYILAIEEENFPKLPAAVFIRGFVSQMARLLKLPHQQVAASYMARLQRANPEKFR